MNTIIRTTTGDEQKACDEAKRLGMEFTLATRTVEFRPKRWDRIVQRFKRARRPVIEDRPVLPGYLFATLADEQVNKLRDMKHVTNFVTVKTNRDAHDIHEFLRRVDRGDFNHDGAYSHLMPGQIVKLVGGPFDTLLVTFKARDGDTVTVEADMMGQVTPMRVSIDEIEPVD